MSILSRKIAESHPELSSPLSEVVESMRETIGGVVVLIRDEVHRLIQKRADGLELTKSELYFLTGIFLKAVPQTVRLEDQRDNTKSPFELWLAAKVDARREKADKIPTLQ